MSGRIRVLVVDDSAFVRAALRAILGSDPAVEVVAEARDGREGVDKVRALRPDVVTMDVSMPVMSGLEAVQRIMEECPTPIIVVSSGQIPLIVQALSFGAMDFVSISQDIESVGKEVLEKVKIASHVRPIRRIRPRPAERPEGKAAAGSARVAAVGVSTGGPQALQVLLSRLPADFPAGILVVQHIAPGFIQGLVDWLSLTSPLHLHLAHSGALLKRGEVLFAPDGLHMTIDAQERISLGELPGRPLLHVPSIDVMMESAARSFGQRSIGVLMTGMGQDGVQGMAAIRAAGGRTLAQDEESSSIFGMNKVAIEKGFVEKVAGIDRMAEELLRLAQ
jgi:two-component system chemotaxis response regulator CheB